MDLAPRATDVIIHALAGRPPTNTTRTGLEGCQAGELQGCGGDGVLGTPGSFPVAWPFLTNQVPSEQNVAELKPEEVVIGASNP